MKSLVALAPLMLASLPLGQESDKKTLMPTCAGCAAEARPMQDGHVATQWNLNVRYIPGVEKNARFRATADFRITPRFTIGVETSSAPETLPRATWFVTPESNDVPSVVLGVTADRLSTPKGEAIFLTLAKAIPGASVTPFVSAKYSTDEKRTYIPFGANFTFDKILLQALYDGRKTHLIATHSFGNVNANVIYARLQYLGFGLSVGF